jgi:arylformamidase
MKLFDVTRPIHEGMLIYEGDPRVVIRPVAPIGAGAPASVSELSLGSHSGTHVDPPRHFRAGAPGVDALPLDILIGPARLCEIPVRGPIDAHDLGDLELRSCPRVLFRTRPGGSCQDAGDSAARGGLTPEAARRLVEAGVRLVGLESLSADPPEAAGFPAHRMLLDAGVIIVEGLDLSTPPPGVYELICLPLRIRDGDGAPARVVLRTLD